LDSVVLLHLLHRLRTELDFALSAIHVHHGLSPRADAWADFCAGLCRDLDVPLRIEGVRVERAGGDGIEAATRRARYRVYAGLAVDFVALAHQQDDQAETILLNLLRGTGVAGMSAMPLERGLPDSRVRLLRPLLETPRAQIERHAREHGLTWVEDESNLDPSFARNHLRHAVLPLIESRFPAYRATLSRAARHFAECNGLLADLARLDAQQVVGEAGLDLVALSRLPRARAKNLLRWYLGELGLRPWPEARLEVLLGQLLAAGPDNRIDIRVGELSLRVWRGRLMHVPAVSGRSGVEVTWQGEESLAFAGGRLHFSLAIGKGISVSRLGAETLTIRTRAGGERLRPDCNRPRRALKKLCQERAIPPWERDRLPLLYVGKELAWVAGLGTDCAYQAASGEEGLVIAWQPGAR
jgi:tRNA(Ile)-lysidine synthase